MNFQVICDPNEFASYSDEWNQLLAESASHVPFLRHEYLFTWWQTLGGGEWKLADLYLVMARQNGGRLCGVAPLFFTENHQGEAALMLLGSVEISDYLDILARPQDLQDFVNGLLVHLEGIHDPAWTVLDFYNILDSSPTLPALKTAAEERGWNYSEEKLHHCPYIPLPGDWETYLVSIDKKQRHEIRRKMRRIEETDVPVRWYILDQPDHMEAEIDDFLNLMAQDREKQAFLTEVMRSQMRAMVKAAFEAGWLQLAFLEIDGEKAAGYLNFDYDSHIWVYNSGMDFRFGTYSPGWVLLGYLLKWANDHGRQAFDFMRGNEDYKYRFGGVDRFVVRASVRR
jgi:CelD/BcsL family acetyltransferase involved in cellulose biosynthesis